ncbi:hypothetical protein NicSoilB4_08460 [Arthrobacter sp. NicSoilB4]|uniref:hypothetical protein n=1 Tax=Arthrobacter sp. NicSoilB4 TaxID=2830997 RepID=UPI001CC441C3|nr:hypothetical protein [Arthrobacter sp. NicSoilB4]BCW66083.1 hypothetical protein NicSoilB4_08460 [Arthrobacter sp. NicSoilB4]
MKKTAFGVLALAGTLALQIASAGPSTAAERRVIAKTVVRGEVLTAEFDHTDGCIQTRVSVFGGVITVRGTTTPEKIGFVAVTQVNTCTQTTLINGDGETDALNLIVPNGLAKGQLTMSLEFTNYADPANPVVSPMTADVSFRATDRATKTFAKTKFVSDGIRFVSSAETKSRAGTATGTVTIGAQSVVSPAIPAYEAMLAWANSKEKSVARRAT